MAVSSDGATSVRRRVRFEQDRRVQHGRAGEQLVQSAHRQRQLHQRDRRRPERPRARRAAQPPVRDDALRQRGEGRSTSRRARRSRASRCRTRSRRASCKAGRCCTTRTFSSANGEASCASCHIFGDKDELAWDLGNPDDLVTRNPIPKRLASGLEIGLFQLVTTFPGALINGTGNPNEFHPMKGPMTTQTLRGLRERGRHALARRPRERLLRRRHAHAAAVRREPVVQQLHRRVRRAARPRRACRRRRRCSGSRTSSCRCSCRRTRSARSTTR